METVPDPLTPFLDRQGVMILDGGLATELEARGHDLADDLWSARMLMDRPEVIREVHLDYLRAGADCIVSASYQATLEGFAGRGLSEKEGVELLERSVNLARESRDSFWDDPANHQGRLRPLVAASVGPYGAFLADGSEFRGDYGLSEEELLEFHQQRWQILTSCDADLVACETLPSWPESRALRRLLEATPEIRAWFSFSCGSGEHLNDGSLLAEVVGDLQECPQIVALGVNCTSPTHISGLIRSTRSATAKPIVIYPNSGECWDAQARAWLPDDTEAPSLESSCTRWAELGARLMGGCCRTGPRQIEELRRILVGGADGSISAS